MKKISLLSLSAIFLLAGCSLTGTTSRPVQAVPTPVQAAPDQSIPTGPQACTEEAKICPDGSAVGRTGPNCEFAPCPGV